MRWGEEPHVDAHRGVLVSVRRLKKSGETGIALLTVLSAILIVSLLAILTMYLTGKEMILTQNARTAADAFYVADGGATVARAAAIQLIENIQNNAVTVAGGSAQLAQDMAAMYNPGQTPPQASNQNPIHLLDYAGYSTRSSCCAVIATGATAGTTSFTYIVDGQDPTYQTKWIEADPGSDIFMNLGDASYVARIIIQARMNPKTGLYIDQTGSVFLPAYTFHYTYTVESRGIALDGSRRVQLTDNFDVVVQPLSFANYAYFDNVFAPLPSPGTCNITPNWWDSGSTFNGPVHTNGELWLMDAPTFLSTVESANFSFNYLNGQCTPTTQAPLGYVHFWENGSPQDVNDYCSASSPTCSMDDPVYCQIQSSSCPTPGSPSFNRLAPYVPPPDNSFNQEWAALGGNPLNTSAVTNQEINLALGLCTTACPTTAPPDGVYLVNTGGQTPTVNGGIFVQSDELERMNFSLDSSDRQVIQFQWEDGNPSLVTTLIVDQSANQTIMINQNSQGSTRTTYSGVPNGVVYATGDIVQLGGRPSTQTQQGYACPMDGTDAASGTGGHVPPLNLAALWRILSLRPPVLGAIGTSTGTSSTGGTSSSGGGSGTPPVYLGSCIQQNSAWTVAAGGTITIDNHIRYEVDPRGCATSSCPGTTWPTSGSDMTVKNILGIVTANGSVDVSYQNGTDMQTSPNNLVIDAFIMASQYQFAVDSYASRPAQGTIYILGGLTVGFEGVTGQTTPQGQLLSGYNLNLSYDLRVPQGTTNPPGYPWVNLQTYPLTIMINGLTNKPVWQELL
jgi:hypothetical protein